MSILPVLGSVGNTPLIKLAGPSALTGCNIMVKAEQMNPGGSVKDRAALFLVREAEEKGWILPGGTIVEGNFLKRVLLYFFLSRDDTNRLL